MKQVADGVERCRWHQGLAYALTGRRWDTLGEQAAPDLAVLTRELRRQLSDDELAAHVRSSAAAGLVWPHPVPDDLMAGLGYAQFAAALGQLRAALGLAPQSGSPRVGTTQMLGADERRLLDEVPPHHGS